MSAHPEAVTVLQNRLSEVRAGMAREREALDARQAAYDGLARVAADIEGALERLGGGASPPPPSPPPHKEEGESGGGAP